MSSIIVIDEIHVEAAVAAALGVNLAIAKPSAPTVVVVLGGSLFVGLTPGSTLSENVFSSAFNEAFV